MTWRIITKVAANNNKRTHIKKVFLPQKYYTLMARRPTFSVLNKLSEDMEESKWDIGEVFQLLVVKGKTPRHIGLGEVISIKRCLVDGLTNDDMEGMLIKPAVKNTVIESLRCFYPEEEINLRTPVELCTMKRFNYDLSELKTLVSEKQ
jgi:hypothetical protein